MFFYLWVEGGHNVEYKLEGFVLVFLVVYNTLSKKTDTKFIHQLFFA